ncbi:MAG: hypothetical protein RLZ97_626 [Verrucomicrobiota bacterium]
MVALLVIGDTQWFGLISWVWSLREPQIFGGNPAR